MRLIRKKESNHPNSEYRSALEIADYMSYQYTHNSTIYETLSANDSDYTGVYEKLGYLADGAAWNLYGNTSDSSTDADNQAIGGKTLASSILNTFGNRANSPGRQYDTSYPLTFYFGEEDAMISLISLMLLDTKSSKFKSIPPYGSAMIFELYSVGASSKIPSDPQDLWVRFSFHNGTDYDSEQALAYPIFHNGPSRWETPWTEFQNLFSGIAMGGISEWCGACSSYASFCKGEIASGDTPDVPLARETKSKLSPVVGGVIGAVVTLAVAGLIFGLAMLFGGIRFHRVTKKDTSDLGGFKGAAKLASDPDLSVPKNRVAPTAGLVSMGDGKKGHERVGSWELRQKEFGKDIGEASPRESFDAIDSVAGKPVEPHDRV